jgi:multicomponent Na+:H+ antiporter subunit C
MNPYALSGIAMVAIGLHGLLSLPDLTRKLLASNVLALGVFLLLMTGAAVPAGSAPDPVPQALVLTGIVVSIATTAVGLSLARALSAQTGSGCLPEEVVRPPGPSA